MTLQTVDLEGVEILRAGGPVFGTGSARGGDYYTRADLEDLARAGRELADEVKPAVKLGHGSRQELLRRSGLALEDGELPAAGWLDNLRADGDRLLADLRRVPRVVAELIKAGAYRHRSVEMRPIVSQRTGRRYAWAVTGLALLGAKAPAVRTLDDIVRLYAAEGVDAGQDGRALATEVNEDGHVSAMRADTGGSMADLTISADAAKKLAEHLGIDGDVTADALTAKVAELAESAKGHEKALADAQAAAKAAEEKAAEAEKAKVDAEKRLADAEAGKGKQLSEDDLRALQDAAKAGVEARETLRVRDRDALIDGAIREFRLTPAERETYQKLYDQAPDVTRKAIEALPVREELKALGDDSDGLSPEDRQKRDDEAYKAYAAAAGIGSDI